MDSAMDIVQLVLPLAALLTLSTRSSTAQLITPAVSCGSLQTFPPVSPPGGVFNEPTINVDPSSYMTGSTIEVTIEFDPGLFAELICQARATGSNDLVGTFTMANGSPLPTSEYQLYICGTNARSTVGTTNPTLKATSAVTFSYMAPSTSFGDVQIRCSFVIFDSFGFIDVASPVISAPQVNTSPTISGCPVGVVENFQNFPVCSDLEQSNLQPSCIPPFGTTFTPEIPVSVTCTCSDGALSDSCSFIVFPQNTPPTIMNCPTGVVGSFVSNPDCTDNEDGTLAVFCTPPFQSSFTPGVATSVTCTCTDSDNVSDVCTFIVLPVTPTDPCSPNPCENGGTCFDIPFAGNDYFCGCPDGLPQPNCATVTPTDPCSPNPCENGGTCFDIPFAGNDYFCGCPVGLPQPNCATVPPQLTCPSEVTAIATTNGANVVFDPLSCTEPSLPLAMTTITCNPPQGFFPIGDTPVSCTCVYQQDNVDTCAFVVTVTDLTPPTILCPDDIVEFVDVNLSGALVEYPSPEVQDNSGTVNLVSTPQASGSFFPIGKTTITFTFSDPSGNVVECTFCITVRVVDNIPPVIIFCPEDQSVTVLTGAEGGVVNFPQPQAQDNSGFVALANDPLYYSGFYFPLGTTTVTYIFSDTVPLTATCTFTVTVTTASPCDSDPCMNGGVCLAVDFSQFRCVCPNCFLGERCQVSQNPCISNNQCLNGGQCRVYPGSCTQTFCDCPPCFTGTNCQISVNPCDNNQCSNGGVCIPSQTSCDSYTCLCSGCRAGAFCEDEFDPCSRAPCQNGGICSNIAESCASYSCQCIGCFTGYNCQTLISDPCLGTTCLNGGICQRVQGTCFGYTCICPSNFGGILCETNVAIVSNPCNNFPCENEGCCVSLGDDDFKCICRSGYTGILCDDTASSVNTISDSCSSNPCANGGTCYNSYNSNTNNLVFVPQYTCACTFGFVGENCRSPIAVAPLFDICSTSAVTCENGGVCRNTYCSVSNDLGVFCECEVGFLGERCQIVDENRCSSSPCRNGGLCTPFSKFFVCTCDEGFSGITCEVPDDDNEAPVIFNCPTQGITVTANAGDNFAAVTWPPLVVTDNSGQVSLVSSNGAPGNYAIGTVTIWIIYADGNDNAASCHFDIRVNPAPIDPCNPSPCQNNGFCDIDGDNFRCTCVRGFTGNTCSQPPDDISPCVSSPCQNDGQCIDNVISFTCQCIGLFTGTLCEVPIDAITCDSNPCQNGGTCFDVQGSFFCSCLVGFSGNRCQDVDAITCDSNPCQNGGTCFDVPGSFFCSCLVGFSGNRCQDGGNIASVLMCPTDIVTEFTTLPTCFDPDDDVTVLCDPFPNSEFPLGITTTVTCICTGGETPDVCMFSVNPGLFNPCTSEPCVNGGTCIPSEGTFMCQCVSPFSGIFCEAFVNPCESAPCQNGGTCILFGGPSICQCPFPFTGMFCETIFVDPCVNQPCQNNGTCIPLSGTFDCQCLFPFSGTLCETVDFAVCPGTISANPFGGDVFDVTFEDPVCPASQQSSCTSEGQGDGPATEIDVCCTCEGGGSGQSQCCYPRIFNDTLSPRFFVTSRNFPGAFPRGITQNTVVQGDDPLSATLIFFSAPEGEVLTIGAGAVIGQNLARTFTSFARTEVLVNDTTLWISFRNNPQSNPAIQGNAGFVFMIESDRSGVSMG